MPLIRKKKAQSALSYITRKAAMRKLQVNLKQFRKLCILKGIFPREPKKSQKHKGHGKIYYYTKDIQFLLHDPLISVIRQQLTLKKKIKRAKKRGELEVAKGLEAQMPSLNLEHILKERYPTFVDALRDMDDALCLMYTFANFQASKLFDSKRALNCQRRIKEWEAYVVKSRSLDKSFVSIKGIYYQAEVFGQKITWITSHKFVQYIPTKTVADLTIMLTFLEFYETMIAYVLYKLYNSLGLHYPPKLEEGHGKQEDNVLNELLQKLDSVMTVKDAETEKMDVDVSQTDKQTNQKENKSQKETKKRISTLDSSKLLSLEDQNNQNEDKTEEKDDLEKEFDKQQNVLDNKTKSVFSGSKFFLSRETPRHSLEFMITALGGEVFWEEKGDGVKENDESITHQIIDRNVQKKMFLSRDYVQPQWVYDCVNEKVLLPPTEYGIGSKLPPHLSPFVDDERVGYIPDRRKKLDKLRDAIINGEPIPEEEEKEDDEEEENEEEEGDEDTLENQYANELKAEISGKVYNEEEAVKQDKKRKEKKKVQQEEETKAAEKQSQDDAMLLLSKKDRNLLSTRKRRQDKHINNAKNLELKRKTIEEEEQKEKKQQKRAKKN